MVMYKFPTVWNFSLSGDVFGKCSESLILEKHHSSTSGSYCLVTIETYGSDTTKCSRVLTFIERADAFCGIFNEFDIPLLADIRYFIQSYRMAEGVHRHTCFNPTTSVYIVALTVFTDFCIPVKPFL